MIDLKEMWCKWRKAKMAPGLNLCLDVPQNEDSSSPPSARSSDAASMSPAATERGSTTSSASFSGLLLSKSFTKFSKRNCAICLNAMKPGRGHAIFTAECSHSFHFHCITSNVKHGSQICPVCRAKWKEIPMQRTASDASHGLTAVPRRLPPAPLDTNRQFASLFNAHEQTIFDDDEPLDQQRETGVKNAGDSNSVGTIDVKTYPEVSAVPRSTSHDNFTVLIHLKAPSVIEKQNSSSNNELPQVSQSSSVSVDLVTVLDISGSMAGTKLALLKRAMGFVIQNLGPSDRLSVIAFSSIAHRLFPLRRMTEAGRQEALQAVNSLTSDGGTNIAEGLRKGVKVMVHRKWKNPVSGIILLSDGHDTYNFRPLTDYESLLPISIQHNGGSGFRIPVHTFGFGADHDAIAMHSISEISGGTFSFIETEGVIQDAFAQCIGGLLSVVVQELQVKVECVHWRLQIGSIQAGSYKTSIMANARLGSVDVGDLYAEEERDFLVTVNIPVDNSSDEMSLLKVTCVYRDPITKDMVTLEDAGDVKIPRPDMTGAQGVLSMEVDRQRNRLQAAEAMANARVAAENGDLSRAVSVLANCCNTLSETASAKAGDRLCIALCAELKEMQERMANRQAYESTGRAYVLSGLSSHSLQRATARGDSTDITSVVQAYQTPSMVDMVTRSQTVTLGYLSPQGKLQHSESILAASSYTR